VLAYCAKKNLATLFYKRFPSHFSGFGFVTFSSKEEAEACFEFTHHTVDGSKVEIKRATPKDEKQPSGSNGEFLRKVLGFFFVFAFCRQNFSGLCYFIREVCSEPNRG
jgi:RNA recognition motif-containing protein